MESLFPSLSFIYRDSKGFLIVSLQNKTLIILVMDCLKKTVGFFYPYEKDASVIPTGHISVDSQ